LEKGNPPHSATPGAGDLQGGGEKRLRDSRPRPAAPHPLHECNRQSRQLDPARGTNRTCSRRGAMGSSLGFRWIGFPDRADRTDRACRRAAGTHMGFARPTRSPTFPKETRQKFAGNFQPVSAASRKAPVNARAEPGPPAHPPDLRQNPNRQRRGTLDSISGHRRSIHESGIRRHLPPTKRGTHGFFPGPPASVSRRLGLRGHTLMPTQKIPDQSPARTRERNEPAP